MKQPCLIAGLTLLTQATPALAGLEVAPVFGNDMVLQQGVAVPVWGEADPGAEVTVSFGDQTRSTEAGEDGAWRVTLDPLEASDDGRLFEIESGTTTETYVGVLVGEVWICSGQFGMTWPLSRSIDGPAVAIGADYRLIRFNADARVGWQPCEPETAGEFSAVAFFFGKAIHETQNRVPVGLILRGSGGAAIESWTPKEKLMEIPFAKQVSEIVEDPALEKQYEEYREANRAWFKLSKEEKATTPKPEFELGKGLPESLFGIYRFKGPGSNFRTHVRPLAPFAIRGVIWYQGEKNAECGPLAVAAYRDLQGALIKGWREMWGQGDFPFFYVQLPNFKGDPGWLRIQESQSKILKTVPNTGMATTFDLGLSNSAHPPDKYLVGDRLALLARSRVYGEELSADTGPRYQNALFGKDSVLLSFDQVGLGLKALEDGLSGFQVAGEDRQFVDAVAKIVDRTHVQVAGPKDVKPVAVRYGWMPSQQATLFNSEDLPAGPFRTDDCDD